MGSQAMSHTVSTVEAYPGESIDDFAARLALLTWVRQEPVIGLFNSIELCAKRGMTREEIKEPFERMNFESYFGFGEWNRRKGH